MVAVSRRVGAGIRTALRQLLRPAGFEALTFESAEEFLPADRRDDAGTVDLIRQAGPVPRVTKPFGDDDLFEVIDGALDHE